MERIRHKILEIEWKVIDCNDNGGIVVGSNELNSLLRKVDQLLYRAKHKSKNLIEKEVSC